MLLFYFALLIAYTDIIPHILEIVNKFLWYSWFFLCIFRQFVTKKIFSGFSKTFLFLNGSQKGEFEDKLKGESLESTQKIKYNRPSCV